MSKYHSYIFNLRNIEANQFDLAGSQALGWKKFFASEIAVADGFVLSSSAFDDFVTAGELIEPISGLLSNLDIDDEDSLSDTSQQISSLIQSTNLPSILIQPLLQAYRSLNGISEKYVRVSCSWVIEDKFVYPVDWQAQAKGEAALLVTIKQAWQQLFTKQNLKLRAQTRYSGGLSMAVVIQKFPTPEASGTAFTLNTKNDIEVIAQLGIFDPKTGSDTYKISAQENQIYEKVIFPQQKMRILKSRANNNTEAYTDISVSSAWQTFQKIPDAVIEKIAKQAIKAGDLLNDGVELDWSWETGRLHIYNIRTNKPLPSLVIPTLEAKVKKQLKIIQIPRKSIPAAPVDIKKLAREIEDMVDTPSQETPVWEFSESNAGLVKSIKSDWDQIKSQLPFNLVLNVSDLSSDTLSQASKYDAFYFDATRMVVRGKILPELIAGGDITSKQKLVQKYLLELKVIANFSQGKPIYYQFSDIGEWELREMQQKTDLAVDGLDRLLTYDQILSIEWEAIRLARKEYGLNNIKLVLPKVRTITEIIQAKKVLTGLGFNRTSVSQVLVEVSLPVILSELHKLDSHDIDGLIVNLPEISQQLLSKLPTNSDLRGAIGGLGEALKKSVAMPVHIITPLGKELVDKLIEANINVTSVIGLRPFTENELTEVTEIKEVSTITAKSKKRGRPSKSLF